MQPHLALVVLEGVAGDRALHDVLEPMVQVPTEGDLLCIYVETIALVVTLHLREPFTCQGPVLLGGPWASGKSRTMHGQLDIDSTVLALGDPPPPRWLESYPSSYP